MAWKNLRRVTLALCILAVPPKAYSSIWHDSRGAGALTFDVDHGELVAMTIHNTARFEMTPDGARDWAALMPSGGHVVHLPAENSSESQEYTPTLFHQLKCLEIYHTEFLKPEPRTPTPLLRHCLNYLRQTLLCQADIRLESVKDARVRTNKQYDTVCRDWTKVYDAAEQNQNAYNQWKKGRKPEKPDST